MIKVPNFLVVGAPLFIAEALYCELKRSCAGYSDFWRYAAHSQYFLPCDAYLKAFGIANVHFITFEELKDNPSVVVSNVLSFLDVDEKFRPDNLDEVYNSGGRFKESLLMRFLLRPSPFKSYFYNSLNEEWTQAYRSLKLKFTASRKLPTPEIPREVRAQFTALFRGDVEALSSKYDVNVKLWSGYDGK
jgi:hypothetical protein